MSAYFETSAIVKLILQEAGSDLATRAWEAADPPFAVRVGYVELHAALAAAVRSRRLLPANVDRAIEKAESLWGALEIVEIDDWLVRLAASVARGHPVAGYDAVHLAAAEALGGEAPMVTWDRRIAAAAHERGLDVIGAI